jgi:hypothetical protein
MGIIAIACYRPTPGNEKKLLSTVRKNTLLLHSLSLITDRPTILMKSGNGVLLEIFEWKSKEAKVKAHKSLEVMALWNTMVELGENVSLKMVPEAKDIFANFKAIQA